MKFLIGYLVAMGIFCLFMAARLPADRFAGNVFLFVGVAAIGGAVIMILERTEK